MKHYFDTSVFLKAYVNEAESAMVKTIVEGSEQVVTSVLTYPEMRAALGRQQRNGRLTVDQEEQAAGQLDRDFGTWPLVGLTPVLAHEAGRLAARHALTGADAVHLASAIHVAVSQDAPPHLLVCGFEARRGGSAGGTADRELGEGGMNSINYRRVALGTILGGVIIATLDAVINGWLLMPWWSRVVAEGVGKPETRGAIALMMGKDVLIAFLLATMYAAVRPRFGPGPRTAVLVGIAGWLLAYLPEFLDTAAWIRVPRSMAAISLLVGLAQCVGATLAAGKVYMESSPTSPSGR